MKYTLKNKPSGNAPISREAYRKWFKNFEERQLKNLADYEKAIKLGANDPCFIRCWEALRNYINLEVLGLEKT